MTISIRNCNMCPCKDIATLQKSNEAYFYCKLSSMILTNIDIIHKECRLNTTEVIKHGITITIRCLG